MGLLCLTNSSVQVRAGIHTWENLGNRNLGCNAVTLIRDARPGRPG